VSVVAKDKHSAEDGAKANSGSKRDLSDEFLIHGAYLEDMRGQLNLNVLSIIRCFVYLSLFCLISIQNLST